MRGGGIGVSSIPSVASDKRSQPASIDWKAITDGLAKEPPVELYPAWLRIILLLVMGLGGWAVVIGLHAIFWGALL